MKSAAVSSTKGSGLRSVDRADQKTMKQTSLRVLTAFLASTIFGFGIVEAAERSQAEWDVIFAKGSTAKLMTSLACPRFLQSIGDSISACITPFPARRSLNKIANVLTVPINGGNTRVGLG